jgi:predicted dinucleotide-utilizing enzyme
VSGKIEAQLVAVEGIVVEAIAGFLRNVNVAVAVFFAGFGPELTRVETYADPDVDRAQHNVVGRVGFGEPSFPWEYFPILTIQKAPI